MDITAQSGKETIDHPILVVYESRNYSVDIDETPEAESEN